MSQTCGVFAVTLDEIGKRRLEARNQDAARRHNSAWSSSGSLKLSAAINDAVARGEMKAPVAMGRSIRQKRAKNLPGSQPTAQAVNSAAPAQALADWPGLPALLDAATGASWLALQVGAATGESWEQGASFAVVADGKPKTAERIERLLANDLAAAVSRFAPPSQSPG